jgi:hypothetical protein
LGLVRGVGRQNRDADGIFGGRVMFSQGAENNQSGGEQDGEGNELATPGLEKV